MGSERFQTGAVGRAKAQETARKGTWDEEDRTKKRKKKWGYLFSLKLALFLGINSIFNMKRKVHFESTDRLLFSDIAFIIEKKLHLTLLCHIPVVFIGKNINGLV